MTTDWAHLITAASLSSDYDAGTIQRGSAYARQRRLVGVTWDEAKRRLTGRCQGSGVSIYSIKIVFSHLGPAWKIADASCTCPVGYFCKHSVALLLDFARDAPESPRSTLTLVPPVPDWEQKLRPLLTRTPPRNEPLGLQMFVTTPDPRRRSGGPQFALRPLRPGTRTAWIRSGIDWPTLMQASPDHFDGRHLSILKRMGSDSLRVTDYGLPHGLILATAPSTIWHQLDEALAAGIPILGDPGSGIVDIRIAAEATLTVDLSGDHGEDAHVSVAMAIDDKVLTTDDVTVLGKHEPHGICYLDDEGVATLAPFDPEFRHIAKLLHTQPVIIPAADALKFTNDFLPRLLDAVPVHVPEGLFTPPTVTGPVGLLTVSFTGDVAHTEWATRYLVNGEPHDIDSGAVSTLPRWRDPAAEDELWERLRDAVVSAMLVVDRAALKALAAYTAGGYPMGVLPPADQIEQSDYDEAVRAQSLTTLRRGLHLNALETARFCAEVLPELGERDDLVVEVDGKSQRFRRVKDRARLRFTGAEPVGSDWLDLEITMDVDDEQVPIKDVISELSTGATHMLLPSGVYFPLDAPELNRLKQLMDEAEALGEFDDDRGAKAEPANVTLWEELLQLGVVDEQLKQWQERVEKLSAARPPTAVEPPAMLHATLRDYQLEGLNWLSFLWDNGFGGILADDMGLGKTLQTLAMFGRARENGETRRFLVVAPTSVLINWAAECHRFTDLKAVTVTATQAKRRTLLADVIADADIVITTYNLLRLDIDAYNGQDWAGMVLDEAQFVKNYNAKNHQAARRLNTPFKLAITGTPMENNLMELWSLLSITVPGLFPDPKSFAAFFRKPIEKGEDPERLPVLRKRIKPVMLRRTKDQVARDLPAKQEQTLEIELSEKHRKIYDTRLVREREVVLGLLGDWEKNRFQIFRSLTMLRQLSLHAGLIDPAHGDVDSAKVTFICEQLPELIAEGHSALIFSQFTGFLDVLRKALDIKGIRYSYLDGSLSSRERAAAVETFTSGNTQVFLISLKAGGFGLNLTEADYCFVCDPWWNPAAEAQAIDRTHRIGQTRPVTVYRLVSADTIEAKVVALQDRKRELFTAVVDDGELFSSAVDADDIRNMLG
ncbi:MAG: helicase SNF2 [Gordonia sp.]|nr:helicase SNF2 [Gordonia sp. (in: high G+C Gram-positive bacteria)]